MNSPSESKGNFAPGAGDLIEWYYSQGHSDGLPLAPLTSTPNEALDLYGGVASREGRRDVNECRARRRTAILK